MSDPLTPTEIEEVREGFAANAVAYPQNHDPNGFTMRMLATIAARDAEIARLQAQMESNAQNAAAKVVTLQTQLHTTQQQLAEAQQRAETNRILAECNHKSWCDAAMRLLAIQEAVKP